MKGMFFRKLNTLEELKALTERAERAGKGRWPYVVSKEVFLKEDVFQALVSDFFAEQDWLTKEEGGIDKDGKVRCVRVVNVDNGERFLINNEGYSYARYTSLEGPGQ